MNIERFKNPYFYIAIIALLFSSTGIDPETLTSWELLKQSLFDVALNPFRIGSFTLAMVGLWMNPTTKGISDK